MTQTIETTAAHTTGLSALDRCDSCGAQAYVRATLESGELTFCAHHAAAYRESLLPTVIAWHDETARLLEDARA